MKKLLYTLGVALALTSCSSDYLDTAPESSIGTATIFETTENIKLAVNGLSRMMATQYLSTQGFNGEGTIKTYNGNFPGNDFQKCNLTGYKVLTNSSWHEMTTSIYLYYPWYYYYKIIGNANAIIAYADDASGKESEKQFLKAQALTFRAYSYLMLSQLYCHRWVDSNNGASRGLPLRLDLSTGDLECSTLAEVYAQIYQDLDDAIAYFKGSSDQKRSYNYEANLDVAYAVYARAALTREDWQTAATNAALAREKYPLMSNTEYKAGFNTPNQEWIWSVYNDSEQDLFYYSYFAQQGSNSAAGMCRNYPCAISKELFDQIPSGDVRKELFLEPQAGETYSTTNGSAGTDLSARCRSEYGSYIYSTSSIYAYMQFKQRASGQPGIGQLNLFRTAEMILTEAEADCHLGKTAAAQQLLVELNQPRNAAYTCTATGDALLTEVKLYRRFELWGEGFDWFDYKRWKEPIVRKTFEQGGSFHVQFAGTTAPEDNNEWTWAFPAREVDYNSAITDYVE